MPFPPTENEPLAVTARDGRVICCCVRSVGRERPHLRWLFAVKLAGEDSNPTIFTGPTYVPREHDDDDAVRALVTDWWETTSSIVGT